MLAHNNSAVVWFCHQAATPFTHSPHRALLALLLLCLQITLWLLAAVAVVHMRIREEVVLEVCKLVLL
jgi:hypothetical protein